MKPIHEYVSVERADGRLHRDIHTAIREVEAACGHRPANVHFFAVEQLRALRATGALAPGATAPAGVAIPFRRTS